VLVELTERGRVVIDRAIDAHLELYAQLTAVLTTSEREALIDLVRKQTLAFERTELAESD
jgi:DNA-binding MarR family transcriptional regulator